MTAGLPAGLFQAWPVRHNRRYAAESPRPFAGPVKSGYHGLRHGDGYITSYPVGCWVAYSYSAAID